MQDGDAFMLASMTIDLLVACIECEFLCKRNYSCMGFASFKDDQAWCQLYYGSKNEPLNIMVKDGHGVVYVHGSATYQQGKFDSTFF